jgi:hypothetical protein
LRLFPVVFALATACRNEKSSPTDPTDPTDPTTETTGTTEIPTTEEVCDDGVDDDGDGETDTRDLDCLAPGELQRATLLEGALGVRLEAATPPSTGGLAILVGGGLRVDGQEELAGSVETAAATLDARGTLLALHESEYDFNQHAFSSFTPDGEGGAIGILWNGDRTTWDGEVLADTPGATFLLSLGADGSARAFTPAPGVGLSELSAPGADGLRCVVAHHEAEVELDGTVYPVGAAGGVLLGLLGVDGTISFVTGWPVEGQNAWHVARLADGSCAVSGAFTPSVTIDGETWDDPDGHGDGLVGILEDDGRWRSRSHVQAFNYDLGVLAPAGDGFVVTGLGAIEVDGLVTGSGWLLDFRPTGAVRRSVAFVALTYAAPTAVVADGDTLYLSVETYDGMEIRVDNTQTDVLPDWPDGTDLLLRLDADGTVAWASALVQDEGSGLLVSHLALEGETLWVAGQIYGAGVDHLGVGGPNELRVAPNGGAGFVGFWAR